MTQISLDGENVRCGISQGFTDGLPTIRMFGSELKDPSEMFLEVSAIGVGRKLDIQLGTVFPAVEGILNLHYSISHK